MSEQPSVPEQHQQPVAPAVPEELHVGDRVRVTALPQYVKTADPMPMLRPPDILQLGEIGTIIDRRPGGYWGVRFANGTFLLEARYFARTATASDDTPTA